MKDPDEKSGSWPPRTDGSATGGQSTSTEASTGVFDPIDVPLPAEAHRDRLDETRPVSSEVIAPSRQGRGWDRTETIRRRPRGKPIRVRRRLQHIDLVGVLKISALFYLVFLLVWLLFVALVFNILDGLGLFDAIEKVNEGLVLDAELTVTLETVLRWAAMAGIIFSVFACLLNVVLALLYNGFARLFGGIDLTFLERDR